MIEWVLDHHARHLHGQAVQHEQSVIVHDAMEAALTPLMEDIERRFSGVKVFSLPSVDHPVHGRHIELGVKSAQPLAPAYAALKQGLLAAGARLGPEMQR
jgi:molybdopterin-biosynthesis enzyme MoeA-like protein